MLASKLGRGGSFAGRAVCTGQRHLEGDLALPQVEHEEATAEGLNVPADQLRGVVHASPFVGAPPSQSRQAP